MLTITTEDFSILLNDTSGTPYQQKIFKVSKLTPKQPFKKVSFLLSLNSFFRRCRQVSPIQTGALSILHIWFLHQKVQHSHNSTNTTYIHFKESVISKLKLVVTFIKT